MPIPSRVHFCWIGTRLPWAYAFAVLSAAQRSGLAEVILHHTDPLESDAAIRTLEDCASVRLSRLDPIACLTATGRELGVRTALTDLYRSVMSPAMRCDILRAAILHRHGGVYLDLDTVTTASLVPLLAARQFVGSEHIVWPHAVRSSRSPAVWCRALTLDLVRKAMRRAPNGWGTFRRIERFYHRGINNAVMGAAADSPLCAAYLRAMAALPRERRAQPYALGPDLLEEIVAELNASRPQVFVAEPQVFYPLPPEISEHWFRLRRGVRLEDVLPAATRVVHWYASVRAKSWIARIDPQFVREHRDRQFYSALVCACVGGLA